MSKTYKYYHSSKTTSFLSDTYLQELRDDARLSGMKLQGDLSWISRWTQEIVDNNKNNNNNGQSFCFVPGPVLSNLHALLYCMTQTMQWKTRKMFLKNLETVIAFSVVVVNILTGTFFLLNTCKLRQHIFRKFLLKTQLAINSVFLFEDFLHLDKKQWEQLL